ncbi:MAG: hypothetical protein ACOX28_01435 [Bacilli bacterium]|jgi:hypothetical protein
MSKSRFDNLPSDEYNNVKTKQDHGESSEFLSYPSNKTVESDYNEIKFDSEINDTSTINDEVEKNCLVKKRRFTFRNRPSENVAGATSSSVGAIEAVATLVITSVAVVTGINVFGNTTPTPLADASFSYLRVSANEVNYNLSLSNTIKGANYTIVLENNGRYLDKSLEDGENEGVFSSLEVNQKYTLQVVQKVNKNKEVLIKENIITRAVSEFYSFFIDEYSYDVETDELIVNLDYNDDYDSFASFYLELFLFDETLDDPARGSQIASLNLEKRRGEQRLRVDNTNLLNTHIYYVFTYEERLATNEIEMHSLTGDVVIRNSVKSQFYDYISDFKVSTETSQMAIRLDYSDPNDYFEFFMLYLKDINGNDAELYLEKTNEYQLIEVSEELLNRHTPNGEFDLYSSLGVKVALKIVYNPQTYYSSTSKFNEELILPKTVVFKKEKISKIYGLNLFNRTIYNDGFDAQAVFIDDYNYYEDFRLNIFFYSEEIYIYNLEKTSYRQFINLRDDSYVSSDEILESLKEKLLTGEALVTLEAIYSNGQNFQLVTGARLENVRFNLDGFTPSAPKPYFYSFDFDEYNANDDKMHFLAQYEDSNSVLSEIIITLTPIDNTFAPISASVVNYETNTMVEVSFNDQNLNLTGSEFSMEITMRYYDIVENVMATEVIYSEDNVTFVNGPWVDGLDVSAPYNALSSEDYNIYLYLNNEENANYWSNGYVVITDEETLTWYQFPVDTLYSTAPVGVNIDFEDLELDIRHSFKLELFATSTWGEYEQDKLVFSESFQITLYSKFFEVMYFSEATINRTPDGGAVDTVTFSLQLDFENNASFFTGMYLELDSEIIQSDRVDISDEFLFSPYEIKDVDIAAIFGTLANEPGSGETINLRLGVITDEFLDGTTVATFSVVIA